MKLKHFIINGYKICSHCRKNKSISAYYPDKRKGRLPNSIRSTCKQCDIIISRNYAKKHPEYTAYRMRYTRLHHYHMTIEQFNALLQRQNYQCAACGTSIPGGIFNQWHVDHDHKCCSSKTSCGKCIRGLLCKNCNTALGLMQDNGDNLRKLANYVEVKKYENL